MRMQESVFAGVGRGFLELKGAYRGLIGQNKLGDFLFVSYMFKVFYGIFGVYIFLNG